MNGIDYDDWSPQEDKFIKQKYSPEDMKGKAECRKDLLKEYGLKATQKIPVIGIISRLADQKGFDILSEGIEEIAKMDVRVVLLGTGEEKYHKLFEEIQKKYPDRFGVKITFNNALAHKIEAGSDMFLMPSKFEPCGLNQIYSLKYGTVPIVRATGGLDDTIENYDPETGKGNGFKFNEYSSSTLIEKIKEAVSVFDKKALWKKLVQSGMNQDFSWERSTKQYGELYYNLLG